jgi:alkylated DNA repair dioxygenase AlkB
MAVVPKPCIRSRPIIERAPQWPLIKSSHPGCEDSLTPDDLFPSAPELLEASAWRDGFCYLAHALSPTEEQVLVQQFEQLAFRPYEFRGFSANRRMYTFGHRYQFAGQRARADAAIPGFLHPLMRLAADLSGKPAEAFAQIMITEYAPGAGIGWHLDRPNYEDIVAVSFLAPCALLFWRETSRGWDRLSVPIAPRSVYLLLGEARTQWQHSTAPMDALRYSVTLRIFRTNEE